MTPKKPETLSSWNIVFPNDANALGTMFGGRLMAIMDEMAGIAALRYAEKPVVTASTEAIIFKLPVRIGDRIETTARVVWVGRSSLVIKLDVYAENPTMGRARQLCTTAHFNFVALDEKGKPSAVAPLDIITEADKKEYQIAEIVKKNALSRKNEIDQMHTGSFDER